MTITLNTTLFMILIIIVLTVLYFIISYFIIRYRYNSLLEEYNLEKRQHLRKSNQISMIEYNFREYKEGKNPFTVLRDIGEIIRNYTGVNIDGK